MIIIKKEKIRRGSGSRKRRVSKFSVASHSISKIRFAWTRVRRRNLIKMKNKLKLRRRLTYKSLNLLFHNQ
jgi:hypothetical protein